MPEHEKSAPSSTPERLIRSVSEHELRTWPEYFGPVLAGLKTFEVRRDDRGFQVGDVLHLREFEPTRGYTGRETKRVVTYVLRDYPEVKHGFAVLGLSAALDAARQHEGQTKKKNDQSRLAPASATAPENLTNAPATGAVSDYDKPLDVTIERDALVIRIGIGVLAHAVTYSDWANKWNDAEDEYVREFAIEDARQFAKDVANMMEREEEDGSSILTNFIDKASEEAVNDGSLGLAEGNHKIKHGEKSPLETW